MSNANRLVDILEQQGLLEAKVLAELRRQIDAKKGGVPAESIAKMLVSKGHLTKFQASKLVEQVSGNGDGGRAAVATESSDAAPRDDDELGLATESDDAAATVDEKLDLASEKKDLSLKSDDDELGLADEPAAPSPQQETKPSTPSPAAPTAATSSAAASSPADEEIVEMEEAIEMEVIAETPAPRQPVRQQPTPTPQQPVRQQPASPPSAGGLMPLGGELEPLGGGLEPLGGGLDPFGGGLDGGFGGFDANPYAAGAQQAGGLAALDAGAGMAGAGTAAASPSEQEAAEKAAQVEEIRRQLEERQKSVWDSKWLLIGGGLLMLLLIALVVLAASLLWGTEQEYWEAAEGDMKSGAYASAIKKFEDYLDKYPKGQNSSKARVWLGTCKLRVAIDQGNDPVAALALTKQVLPEIENEKEIKEGRAELAALLPTLCEKLLTRADAAPTTDDREKYLGMIDETIKLVETPVYVTRDMYESQGERIDRIRDARARIEREINRSRALAAGMKDLDAALAAGDIAAAYAARGGVLKVYPELETSDEIRAATQRVTDALRQLTVSFGDKISPLTDEAADRSANQIVLAARTGSGAASEAGKTVYLLADGGVYAVQADTGAVRWRRNVGAMCVSPPQPAKTDDPTSDAILVDAQRNELVRVAAADGKPVWRFPVGEPFHSPLVADSLAFIATESGRLLSVDLATGESFVQAKLPQPAAAWPTTDARRGYIYQLGDHSNLYVLSKDSLNCAEVFYLGHSTGTVAAPPVMSLGHMFVAVNAGPDYSLLYVVATDTDGVNLKIPQDPFRLRGHVLVPPFLAGRRVVVMTDRGSLHIFDVEPTETEKPVTEVLSELPKTFETYLTYPFVDNTNLWMAGQNLAYYEMQFASGKLKRNWIEFAGDAFVATPQKFGDALVSLRRPSRSAGYLASAIHGTNKSPMWQTALAVPAGKICVDGAARSISVVSSRGDVFKIDGEAVKSGFATPSADLGTLLKPLSLTDGVEFGTGTWGLVDREQPGHVAAYDPSSERPIRLVTLDVGSARATSPPVAFAGGVVVPLSNGQLMHFDLTNGNHAQPFQPPLEPNKTIVWRRPAVISDGRELVIADNRLKIYRLGISEQGRRNLHQISAIDTGAEIVSPLAAVGNTLFGVMQGGSGDIVATFQVPSLTANPEVNLDGRVTWGPEVAGDLVLLISDSEGLIAFDGSGARRWARPWGHDAVVGQPTIDEGKLLFTSASGEMWYVDPATGDELGTTKIDESLAAGAVPFGTRLLVSGRDGTLHVVAKPQASAASASGAN